MSLNILPQNFNADSDLKANFNDTPYFDLITTDIPLDGKEATRVAITRTEALLEESPHDLGLLLSLASLRKREARLG